MLTSEEKRTLTNTRHFFKSKYNRLLAQSNEINSIQGMHFDAVAAKTNYTGAKENIYLRIIDAQQIIKSVNEAIDCLQDDAQHPYKTIMQLLYLKNKTDTYTIMHIQYERSTYFSRIKPQALLTFANLFEIKQLENGVVNIIDLHAQ